jgi:hypothetical protein
MLESLEYVGFLVVVVFSVTGAYIWMRWGYCGVQTIWRFRAVMDATVREDVSLTLDQR